MSCPGQRPDFRTIRTQLRPLRKGMRSNIFDNMLAMMEKYANNLEALVAITLNFFFCSTDTFFCITGTLFCIIDAFIGPLMHFSASLVHFLHPWCIICVTGAFICPTDAFICTTGAFICVPGAFICVTDTLFAPLVHYLHH